MPTVRTIEGRTLTDGCGPHCTPATPESVAVHCTCCHGRREGGLRVYDGGGNLLLDTAKPRQRTPEEILADTRKTVPGRGLLGLTVQAQVDARAAAVTFPAEAKVSPPARFGGRLGPDRQVRLTIGKLDAFTKWVERLGGRVVTTTATKVRPEPAEATKATKPRPTTTTTTTSGAPRHMGAAEAAREVGREDPGVDLRIGEIVARAAAKLGVDASRCAGAVQSQVYGYPGGPHPWKKVGRGLFRYEGDE